MPIYRDSAQEGEIISNERIVEEFLLGHKIKERVKGKADHGNICPVLVLRKNDHRPMIRKSPLRLGLNPVKNGENPLSNLSGHGIDERVSSHHTNLINYQKGL